MKLLLKLNTAFGRFFPSEFFLTENEIVEISLEKKLKGKGVLQLNSFSYAENKNGVFEIPAIAFKNVNVFTLLEYEGARLVQKYTLGGFYAVFPPEQREYEEELKFYKNQFLTSRAILEKLHKRETEIGSELTKNAEDISTLVTIIAEQNERISELERIVLDKVSI